VEWVAVLGSCSTSIHVHRWNGNGVFLTQATTAGIHLAAIFQKDSQTLFLVILLGCTRLCRKTKGFVVRIVGCTNAAFIHNPRCLFNFQVEKYRTDFVLYWLALAHRRLIPVHKYPGIRPALYGSAQLWQLHGSCIDE
jgi:hypothetical protein